MLRTIIAVLTASAIPVAAAAVVAVSAAVTTPAGAQGIDTPFLMARIRAVTPQCNMHPEYGVVGRVAGQVSGRPARTVSFVGCFPDFASCERWRGPVSGAISGRIILATCEPRR